MRHDGRVEGARKLFGDRADLRIARVPGHRDLRVQPPHGVQGVLVDGVHVVDVVLHAARAGLPLGHERGQHAQILHLLQARRVGRVALIAQHLDEARALRPRSWRAENQLYETITRAYALTELGRSVEAAAALANARELAQRFGAVLVGHTIEVRAGILARWASALLAVATVSTAALAVLPESFNRPFAVPTGIALMGLGISLWRTTGTGPTAHGTDAGSSAAATRGEPTPVR